MASTTLIAKTLGNSGVLGPEAAGLSPFMVTAARFFFAAGVWIIAWKISGRRLQNPDYSLHLKRTVLGWATVTLIFAASAKMILADATAISFLNPLVAMVLAVFMLGEKVGPVRWFAAAVMILGAVILIQPGSDAFQIAALLALGAAFTGGVEVIYIKQLTNREPLLQVLLVNNLMGLCLALIPLWFIWSWPTQAQWALLVMVGLCMATAQLFFITAIKSAEASFVTPFMYSTLLFAAFLDFMVFGALPTSIGLLGALIVVTGAVLLAWREGLAQRRSAR
ncbi:DMT family transporter [Alphaproteobacteria bacterium]|nr:DMT family transporter [Alphaproteobacteria bacterium]